MPQARSSGSKSASTSGRSQTKRASAAKSTGARAAKSTGAKRTTRKTASAGSAATKTRATKSASSRSTSARSSASSANGIANGATAADPRLEAVAQRVRKLNEKIIEESKAAGEATLSSYEKALKAIASTLERGPGTSDVEWIASLATTQAKFIREVTAAWTAAARGVLK